MNTDIPTPETNAAIIRLYGTHVCSKPDEYASVELARSLERRLAVAVEALMAVGNQRIGKAGIAEALAQISKMKGTQKSRNP